MTPYNRTSTDKTNKQGYYPPGIRPKNRFLNIGRSLALFRNGPLHSLVDMQRQYGDLVSIPLAQHNAYLVNHPTYIQHVLRDNNRNYVKPQALTSSIDILGNGLLTSDGEFWRKQRRLIQPAFHRKNIDYLANAMMEATDAMLARWAMITPKDRFDVTADMMQLTLDIVTRTLFGAQLSHKETARITAVITPLLHSARRQLLRPLGSFWAKLDRNYQANLQLLNETIEGLIAKRRDNPTDELDLLNLLLEVKDEETGLGMDNKQIRDEAMTIFLAGHETTANLLSWTWMLLSQHPMVRHNLFAEIDGVLNGRLPTSADMADLPLTRAIIDESMRLYPPAWAFLREAIADDKIGGYNIPAGSNLLISPYILHRHPEFWDNPEEFDPERFMDDKRRTNFSYLPFGGGPRVCIGQHFAIMEAMLVVVMVCQKYRIDLTAGPPIQPATAITLRPKGGLIVTIQPRK